MFPAILGDVFDLCFPRRCALCDAVDEISDALCAACNAQLSLQAGACACERCAAPIPSPGAPCPWCHGDGRAPLTRIVRLGVYEQPVSRLVKQLKYYNAWTVADLLADRLFEHPPARSLLDQADVVVPIPLHPWRQLSRGYNQAELIAQRLARRSGKPCRCALVRLKHTETQTQFHSRPVREQNLRDAFGLLHPRQVRGRNVLLVDDVMTTAATLLSAARTIKEAEPATIDALVVAIADPRGHGFTRV